MSTLKVTNIQDTSGGNSLTTEQVYNGAAKAWVNFNGSGVIAILASFNVSSITDIGNGDYTVNLTNALVDSNFSAVMTSSPKVGTNGQYNMIIAPQTSTTNAAGTRTRSSSSIRIRNENTNIDSEDVNVVIFR